MGGLIPGDITSPSHCLASHSHAFPYTHLLANCVFCDSCPSTDQCRVITDLSPFSGQYTNSLPAPAGTTWVKRCHCCGGASTT